MPTHALLDLDLPALTWLALLLNNTIIWYAVVFLFLLVVVWGARCRARCILVSFAVLLVAIYAVKAYYHEARDCDATRFGAECPWDYGFPSGHAAISFFFVGASMGTPLFAFYFIVGALVSLTRLYLGVHTITQVAGGIVIGMACYYFVDKVFYNRGWKKGI
ncbi:MAG: phosphatase PAP2 family protein [Candidatus Micrarchaeota archaeon]